MSKNFYLVSDTHGYVTAYRNLDKIATVDKKAYILGDLFDHTYGDERELLSILVNMLNEDRAIFIIGNHDLRLFNILFPIDSYECKVSLLKYSNNIVLKVIKGLYSERVYNLVKMYIEDFRKTHDINRYIDSVSYAIDHDKFKQVNTNLRYLYNDYKAYVMLEVNNKRILLTHSGDAKDPYSNMIISHDFKPSIGYDFAFMGHITTTHLKMNLFKLENPLKVKDFIKNKHSFGDVNVKGSFLYNSIHNVFMIDNGTHNNVIEVTFNWVCYLANFEVW